MDSTVYPNNHFFPIHAIKVNSWKGSIASFNKSFGTIVEVMFTSITVDTVRYRRISNRSKFSAQLHRKGKNKLKHNI